VAKTDWFVKFALKSQQIRQKLNMLADSKESLVTKSLTQITTLQKHD